MLKIDKVFIILIVAGIIGLLMMIFGGGLRNELGVKIVENVGMGLFVAFIVGIAVEMYVRRRMTIEMDRMLKDVGTDVFKAALGHEFPESIWKQVTAHLLQNQFIRKDLTIDFQLESIKDGSDEFIKAQMCIVYTLINLNNIPAKYPLACSVDRGTHVKYRDSTKFTRIKIGEEEIPLDNCQTNVDESEITCRREIPLKPNERKTISINSEGVYSNHETIPFSLTDSTENFTIHVCKPSNINVAVDTLHPREERLREEPTAAPESHKSWRIDGGLLPGHGISVRWFPS